MRAASIWREVTKPHDSACRPNSPKESVVAPLEMPRIFPDKPISKKPAETRMGHGKGNPEEWVAVVRPGRVMYELEGVDETLARQAFHLAEHKLSVQTRFLSREGML